MTHVHDRVPSSAERRTLIVALVATATMLFEIAGGLVSGSMALLADGLHMASHTLAMGIAVAAYRYARRHAASPRFTFGTGKVNVLGGYTGAILLSVTALWMIWESVERALDPTPVQYGEAASIAAVGLLVNAGSAWLLRSRDPHDHHHHDHHHHTHDHDSDHHADHNLRAAYLHVVADAATSVMAIAALLVAQRWQVPFLDPAVGLVGAGLVGWWSVGLLQTTAAVLLDNRAPNALLETIASTVEAQGDRLLDVRCWAVGHGRYAAAVTLRAGTSTRAIDHKTALERDPRFAWVVVEVLEAV